MIHKTSLLVAVMFMVLTFSGHTNAQSQNPFSCPEIVNQALVTADMVCSETGRNQICYGNSLLNATSQADVTDFKFDYEGDIERAASVQTLHVNAMDEALGVWGVALMRLQANLPDTLPGQNVTFVLFGDVQITNADNAGDGDGGAFTPMQAFYLTTGIGLSRCEDVPQDGVLVQTPEGVGEVSFMVNEVEIDIGSTAFLQAQPQSDMVITMLEGAAAVRLNEAVYPVVEGTRLRFGIDDQLQPVPNQQPILESYNRNDLANLPITLLERPIAIRDGFSDRELALAQSRMITDEPLCGEAPFLSCTRLPVAVGGDLCVLADSRQSSLTQSGEGKRSLCDTFTRNTEADLGILASPTPTVSVARIVPTSTLELRIQPTATQISRTEPTATPIPRFDPTATPMLRVDPTATPLLQIAPTATLVSRIDPTLTPSTRSDSTNSLSLLMNPLDLITNFSGPSPTATPKIEPTATPARG